MSDEAVPTGTSSVNASRPRRRRPSSTKTPTVTPFGGRRPPAADTPGPSTPGQLGTPAPPEAPRLTGTPGRPNADSEAPASAAVPAETVLRFRAGSVLLVAGIPGAGKSTLIHRLFGTAPADVLVLDSADIRAALAHSLGQGMPYRLYRPVVHTVHYARIAAWTLGSRRTLVVHECGTRDWARHTMAVLATLRRRPAHLLLLDTPPELALAGQRSRGRAVRTRSFLRHSRQLIRLGCAVDAMTTAPPAVSSRAGGPGPAPTRPARPGPTRPGAARLGAARPEPARAGAACPGAGCWLARAPDLRREGWASARRLDRDQAAALRAIYFDR